MSRYTSSEDLTSSKYIPKYAQQQLQDKFYRSSQVNPNFSSNNLSNLQHNNYNNNNNNGGNRFPQMEGHSHNGTPLSAHTPKFPPQSLSGSPETTNPSSPRGNNNNINSGSHFQFNYPLYPPTPPLSSASTPDLPLLALQLNEQLESLSKAQKSKNGLLHHYDHSRSSSLASWRSKLTRIIPPIDKKIVFLCTNWYLFSIVSSNSTKMILSNYKYPITLTQMQFLLNGIFCVCLLQVLFFIPQSATRIFPKGSIPNFDQIGNLQQFFTPTKLIISTTLPMGMFQFIGHITSHKATSIIPVSMVQIIKTLSPIVTIAIYLVLYKRKFRTTTYITLVPLIIGIMITCYKPKKVMQQEDSYLKGLIYAFISMLIFVSQNIFAKTRLTVDANKNGTKIGDIPMKSQDITQKKVDKLTILFYCSMIGFIFTFPVYLISELKNDKFSLSQVDSYITLLVLVNGFSHFMQSLLAFQILGSISPINYSIANILKRIFIILVAFVVELKNFSRSQTWGLVITLIGLYSYDRWGAVH
ncbi:suppressor of loss of ypt1 [Scheffersomyces spartinae]|uniref:Suppressor of loss of ypt1 n=1 Tax=Scheffersomyces spartinae TaxID=45513 RepID=A0A9P7V5Q5_9ASCO|nr:suppressor of loss of ypt1 [Scheffersomyces spartinae]KAG7191872.1 suppressor of loss of ypt1 [Scheffersomyces spartinae]